MKSKSGRMKPVQRVTEAREQAAAKELGAAQRMLQEQEARLTELQGYQADYLLEVQRAGSAGISAAKFMELQRFLANLDRAVEQQRMMVNEAVRVCEQKKHRWQDAYRHNKSLGKVVERYSNRERYDADRREQKESDEMAQHPGRGRPGSGEN